MESLPREILVAEQDAEHIVHLCQHLEKLGCQVVATTGNGAEAVALASDKRPHLVLMGVDLSGDLDGISAAQIILGDHGIPSIYICTQDDPESVARVAASGPHVYILKPSEERELRLAIDVALCSRACENELKDTKEQLLQSEKLATIGQLAAGVAHEINNPAGYVKANVGSLAGYIEDFMGLLKLYEDHQSHFPDDVIDRIEGFKKQIDLDYLKDDVFALIAESQEGLDRLRRIVQDLKDFSRVDEAEWQWADIHQGIESTLNIVQNEIKYKATVIKQFGPLPQVECIISQINQVIMNLLVNAAHAIEDHGDITLATGTRGQDEVWISVHDTGKGIAKEDQRRIIEPFFTTKPVGEGTGLGLSLSYSIIERHGGSLELDSAPGKGATFTIRLPVRQERQPETR